MRVMAQADILKHRRILWLKSEQAFGLESVRKTEDFSPSPAAWVVASAEQKPAASAPALQADAVATPLIETALPREQKISLLAEMDAKYVKPCTRCRLCETRTNTVFGEGDPDAKIFFIGEGPGENEDLQGRPFVGRAGELLNKMIAGMGLRREQVFIANIVKCRPPDNRVPAPDEVETCTPYLVRQLEIIHPKVIVTLGLPASKYMLESRLSMGKLRGQWHNWRGIKLMPTFHPAYLLRSYTEENRAAVWSDLKQVMAEVGLPIPSRPRE
jgi:DNA polymerase